MNQEDVEFFDTPWGKEAMCKKCGSSVMWKECWKCNGEGFSGHDCGEDTCCCLDPLPNIICDVCDGDGGWHVCLGCDGKETER